MTDRQCKRVTMKRLREHARVIFSFAALSAIEAVGDVFWCSGVRFRLVYTDRSMATCLAERIGGRELEDHEIETNAIAMEARGVQNT